MAKPIVIKYGGSLLEDPAHRGRFLADVVALAKNEKVVLVHGGGKEITRALESSGLPTRFVQGRRFTDEATMKVVERVLAEINRQLVATLREQGVEAVGFSGKSERLMIARPVPELGRVGQPQVVNQTALERMLAAAQLPVFFSVALDSNHQPLNLNADDFALAIAVTCQAKRLVFLTDSGGVLDHNGRPLAVIGSTEVEALIESQTITGGMIVKARACVEALRRGVGRVDVCKGIKPLVSPDQEIDGTSFLEDPARQN